MRANLHSRGLVLSPAEALQLFHAMDACLKEAIPGEAVSGVSPESDPGRAAAWKGGGAAAAPEIEDLQPDRHFAGATFLSLEEVRHWGAALLRRLEELTVAPRPGLTRAVAARLACTASPGGLLLDGAGSMGGGCGEGVGQWEGEDVSSEGVSDDGPALIDEVAEVALEEGARALPLRA